MHRLLRFAAVLLVVAATGWWWFAGANRGWWRTQTAVERTDEVTGLTVKEWQPGFVPGVETPLLAGGTAAVLLGLSAWLARRRPSL